MKLVLWGNGIVYRFPLIKIPDAKTKRLISGEYAEGLSPTITGYMEAVAEVHPSMVLIDEDAIKMHHERAQALKELGHIEESKQAEAYALELSRSALDDHIASLRELVCSKHKEYPNTLIRWLP